MPHTKESCGDIRVKPAERVHGECEGESEDYKGGTGVSASERVSLQVGSRRWRNAQWVPWSSTHVQGSASFLVQVLVLLRLHTVHTPLIGSVPVARRPLDTKVLKSGDKTHSASANAQEASVARARA